MITNMDNQELENALYMLPEMDPHLILRLVRREEASRALTNLKQYTNDDILWFHRRCFPGHYQQESPVMHTKPSPDTQNRYSFGVSSAPSQTSSDYVSQSSNPSRSSSGTDLSGCPTSQQSSGSVYKFYDGNRGPLPSVPELPGQHTQSWGGSNKPIIHYDDDISFHFPALNHDGFPNFSDDNIATVSTPATLSNSTHSGAGSMDLPNPLPAYPVSMPLFENAVLSSSPLHTQSPLLSASLSQYPSIAPQKVDAPAVKETRRNLVVEKNKKKKLFCPYWQDCSCEFSGKFELSKHVHSAHERCDEYSCKDHDCQKTWYHESSWKSHHTKDHKMCRANTSCQNHKVHQRKKYWGCNLCEKYFSDVDSWINHFFNHVRHENKERRDCDYSQLIRSLLSQNGVKDRWVERITSAGFSKDHLFKWNRATSKDLLDNLQRGEYDGESSSEPGKIEELIERAFTLVISIPLSASTTRKRPNSGSSTSPRPVQRVQSQAAGRLLNMSGTNPYSGQSARRLAHP